MLVIKNLVKKYGNKTAVNGINLEIKKGEILGFIGHNGAGKTTVIKCVVGIHDYDNGEIYINGNDMKKDDILCKKDIAYIPDNPEIYENFKGIEYLNYIADIYEVDTLTRNKYINKYAKDFEIYDNLNDVISSYSHGMKQKLAIISALIHRPKLLILDEPFVGLDPKAQFKLKEIMKEICKEGSSVFFSSHILEVVEKLCDKIAMINKGNIVVFGDTKEILESNNLEEIFLKEIL